MFKNANSDKLGIKKFSKERMKGIMNYVKENTIGLLKHLISFKALISLFVAFMLVFSLCPVTAFSEENTKEHNQENTNKLKSGNSYSPKVDNKHFEALFNDFTSWNKDASADVQWGTNAFIPSVLGLDLYPALDKPSEEMSLLKEISQKQNDIINDINNLNNSLQITEINERLNEFKSARGVYFLESGCGDLAQIDKDYVTYLTGQQTLTEEIKKEIEDARKDTVLAKAGISDYTSASTDLDTATLDLGRLLTEDYLIGQETYSLFALKQKQMRNKTFWEHQAWDEIDAFNTNVLSTYMSLALFDIASLKARIQWCDKNGISTVLHKEVLSKIKKSMSVAIDLYNKYQLPKDDSYKHFWNGTQDLYFDQTSISYTIPKESYCGVKPWEDQRAGFDRTDGYKGDTNKNSIKENFWSAVKPKGTITTEIVNKMLQSAAETKASINPSLKEILELGGFNNLPNFDDASKTPVLLFDSEDKDNPFSIQKSTLRIDSNESTDNAVCWIARMPQPKGTMVNQNSAIQKGEAYAVNTYSYQSRTDWVEGYGNKYYYRVQDKRNTNEEYFSLLVLRSEIPDEATVENDIKTDFDECTNAANTSDNVDFMFFIILFTTAVSTLVLIHKKSF